MFSSSTRLYGGIERPSYQSPISKRTIPTVFVGILGFLRFAQEGFSFDIYSIILFATTAVLLWKFRA